MWWILVTVAVVAISYWLMTRPHKYWKNRGVEQGKPMFLFGHSFGLISQRQSAIEMVEMIYNMAPNTRYSGVYNFFQAVLLLKDPDLIKQMTVKDFEHFADHPTFVPEDIDPLWSNNLFALTGKKWREMRSTLSPAFTSSKMKFLFSLISQSGQQFISYFLEKNEDIVTIEMKDTFTRFTNDVIANTVFGIKCDSLKERNNEFFLIGKEVTNFKGFWNTIKFMLFVFIPKILKFSKVRFFSKTVSNFLRGVVKDNIDNREKLGIVRPDMIHLLLEARKNELKQEELEPSQDTGFATVKESEIDNYPKNRKKEITDGDITSQVLIFFFAGFDTVSTLMCFMSYELAVNPNVQDRLIQEVDEAVEACKGNLTYETLLGMKYMDMVVSETLRKWPPNVALNRLCTKRYTIEPKYPDEKPVYLEKGASVWLPVFGIHRDPKYYPDPDRFDVDRFSDGNKEKIKPCTYLPFGNGPRNCIGSRFALLETKILFFYLLAYFEIVPVEKTQIPLKIDRKSQLTLSAEGGFWLGLKRRVKM